MSENLRRQAVAGALIAVLCAPAVLTAQRASSDTAATTAIAMDTVTHSRWSQPVVTVRYGSYRLTANSAFYRLIDQALQPGSDALRPNLWSVDLGVALTSRLRLQVGLEHGSRTTGSQSRTGSVSGSPVEQRTTLTLSSVYLAGAQWRLARWSSPSSGQDRARLFVHAGAGVSMYRVRQTGEFIDINRKVTFGQDFSSSGGGRAGYLGAALELPVRPWVSLTGDWRLQRASAPMTDDFASFDRIDLGGARASLGMTLFPRANRRR